MLVVKKGNLFWVYVFSFITCIFKNLSFQSAGVIDAAVIHILSSAKYNKAMKVPVYE